MRGKLSKHFGCKDKNSYMRFNQVQRNSIKEKPAVILYNYIDRHGKGTRKQRQRHTMCLHVFSSHLFWTSGFLDVPVGVTQEEGHTGILIHLPSAVLAFIFLARRIQPLFSFVGREVEFCVLTI